MNHVDDTLTQKNNLAFIKGAMSTPMLERDDEFDLARRWREKGDEKALHRLIAAYTRLVVAVAMRFKAYGLPLGDLIQEGHVGLLEAANRFEVSRELRFSTYATWWIRAAMQDYVLKNWSIVRTGTNAAQKSLFFNLRRLRAKIEGKARAQGHLDTVFLSDEARDEIATALRVSAKDVARMDQRLAAQDYSLNAPVHDEADAAFQDFLVDDAPTPEEQVTNWHDRAVRHRWLDEGLKTLDARERQIIALRHLVEDAATLDDLGHKLHISKERVRQLEARALAKLKAHLADHADAMVAA